MRRLVAEVIEAQALPAESSRSGSSGGCDVNATSNILSHKRMYKVVNGSFFHV